MTLADLAAVLGIDDRSVRRDEASLLRKLRRGFAGVADEPELVVRAIVLVLDERAKERTIPRRFSDNPGESAKHAPRVDFSPEPDGSASLGRRAGLPSRWRKR